VEEKKIENKFLNDSKITLSNRKILIITGVTKVISVKDNELNLEASGSGLIVQGAGLEVTKLDVAAGILEVSGLVDSLRYTSIHAKQNLFKRIFK